MRKNIASSILDGLLRVWVSILMIFSGFSIFFGGGVFAADFEGYIPPENDEWVTDMVGAITESEEVELEATLESIQLSGRAEIAILVLDTLENSNTYLERLILDFEEYKTAFPKEIQRHREVGDEEKDNGVIIFVIINDRKWRIEVGYGLEGIITDSEAKRLGENILVPYFRKEMYGAGLISLVDTLQGILNGSVELDEVSGDTEVNDDAGGDFLIFFMVLTFFLGLFFRPLLKTDDEKLKASGIGSSVFTLISILLVGWVAIFYIIPLFFVRLFALFAEPSQGNYNGSYGGGSYGGGSFGGGSSGGGFGGFGGGSFGGGGSSGGR